MGPSPAHRLYGVKRTAVSGLGCRNESRTRTGTEAPPGCMLTWNPERPPLTESRRVLPAALADLILVAHLGFVIFVTMGAVAVYFKPRLAWLHLPCLAYGAALEFIGWVCPLTPIEQGLRLQAGQEGYTGGFIEHYVGGLLYPGDWDALRVWLGILLVAFNVVTYCLILARTRRNRLAG